jgi:hypothetical protein
MREGYCDKHLKVSAEGGMLMMKRNNCRILENLEQRNEH